MKEDVLQKVFSKELLEKMKDENPFRKLSEIVYEMTEDAIISCELHPGTQLNTVKISKLLDISRTPVTDALEQLLNTGLVTASPEKRGYYVFDISYDFLEKLIEARRAIENYASFMCAQRSGELDLRELRDLAAKFRDSVRNWDHREFARIDQLFHQKIIENCGNELIKAMYKSILQISTYTSNRVEDYIEKYPPTSAMRGFENQHMAIYNAIALSLPDMAFAASDRHLDSILILCLKGYKYMDEEIRID
jgi:DNA-binding GntR family transcriptional regulator